MIEPIAEKEVPLNERVAALEAQIEADKSDVFAKISKYGSIAALLISIVVGVHSIYVLTSVEPEVRRVETAQRIIDQYSSYTTQATENSAMSPGDAAFSAAEGERQMLAHRLAAEIRIADDSVFEKISSGDLAGMAWALAEIGQLEISNMLAVRASSSAVSFVEQAAARNTLAFTETIAASQGSTDPRAPYSEYQSWLAGSSDDTHFNQFYFGGLFSEVHALGVLGHCDDYKAALGEINDILAKRNMTVSERTSLSAQLERSRAYSRCS